MSAVTSSYLTTTNATLHESNASLNTISFRYLGIAIASFAIIVGSIGNLLTILAFAANQKLQTTFNVFVVNLSIVDFLTATAMLPFNLAGYIQMQWPFGNSSFTTRLQAFSYFTCGYTSIVFLVVITINRFIGVFSPTRYEAFFSKKRLIFIVIFCWTFAPICLLPFLIGSDASCDTPGHALTGFRTDQLLCTFLCLPPDIWHPYMQFTRIVFQFLPLGIMLLVYGSIFLKLKLKTEKMVRTRTMSLQSNLSQTLAVANIVPINGKHSSPKHGKARPKSQSPTQKRSLIADTRRNKENMRMLLISVTICIGFLITFLPSVIINLLPNSSEFDPRYHMLASNLSWFNCSINPIIYVLLNRRFRKEYVRLVRMVFGKVKGNFIHDATSSVHPSATAKRRRTGSNVGSSVINQNMLVQITQQAPN